MATLRVRGQEAQVQIVVDGDLKGSSFAKVTDFTLTPKQDVSETGFLGETEDDFDFTHRGYDWSFRTHERSDDINQVLALIVANEAQHLPHPDITIIIQVLYRDLTGTTSTITLEKCFMKMDNKTIGGSKDFITNSFSGKCRIASVD